MTDKSVVVYLSEQGNSLPLPNGLVMMRGTLCLYRSLVPGVVKPGSVSDALVEYVDIVPTLSI